MQNMPDSSNGAKSTGGSSFTGSSATTPSMIQNNSARSLTPSPALVVSPRSPDVQYSVAALYGDSPQDDGADSPLSPAGGGGSGGIFEFNSGGFAGGGGGSGGSGVCGGNGGQDFSSDVALTDYRGEKVASFDIAGDVMLCLPQAYELFLKHLVGGLHTVYTKLKRLDIKPYVCNVEQVRALRSIGAIQPGVNRCKLISRQHFDLLLDDCASSK